MSKTTYLSEVPIGTKFTYGGHYGVNTLTHKLGENGYAGTTYPFRYRDNLGTEITANINLEITVVDPKNWEDCWRDDLRMIPEMEAAGFKPRFSRVDMRYGRTTPENCPLDPVTFRDCDRNLVAFKTYNNGPDRLEGWAVATLDPEKDVYVDRKDYGSLEEVIAKRGKDSTQE